MYRIITIGFILLLMGCSCDSPDINCGLTRDNLIGSWKITAMKYKENAQANEVDVYANSAPCKKDDIYVFSSDSTYHYNDLGTFCSPPDSYEGKWNLLGLQLTFDSANSYTISNFNCSSMNATKTGTTTGEYLLVTFTRQ